MGSGCSWDCRQQWAEWEKSLRRYPQSVSGWTEEERWCGCFCWMRQRRQVILGQATPTHIWPSTFTSALFFPSHVPSIFVRKVFFCPRMHHLIVMMWPHSIRTFQRYLRFFQLPHPACLGTILVYLPPFLPDLKSSATSQHNCCAPRVFRGPSKGSCSFWAFLNVKLRYWTIFVRTHKWPMYRRCCVGLRVVLWPSLGPWTHMQAIYNPEHRGLNTINWFWKRALQNQIFLFDFEGPLFNTKIKKINSKKHEKTAKINTKKSITEPILKALFTTNACRATGFAIASKRFQAAKLQGLCQSIYYSFSQSFCLFTKTSKRFTIFLLHHYTFAQRIKGLLPKDQQAFQRITKPFLKGLAFQHSRPSMMLQKRMCLLSKTMYQTHFLCVG